MSNSNDEVAFLGWLARAQVTPFDFSLTVEEVGFKEACRLVQERIDR